MRLSRVAATALGALLVLTVIVVMTRRGGRPTVGGAGPEGVLSDGATARAPLPSVGAGALPSVPSPSVTAPEPTSEQLASLMKSWHAAIVTKNAATVESLDREFAARPERFVAALMANAEGDPEERVRSFSTRVLGKLRRPETVEVLRRLLKDGSQYVRYNAAWALGELNDREAAPSLSRLERHDPSPMVRESAGTSRRKIEGS